MNERLREESDRLAASWEQHSPELLGSYLVSNVEDPRINLQSILTRHFLIRACFGNQFDAIMSEECRFAAILNWFLRVSAEWRNEEDLASLRAALERGIDNFEGTEIPRFVLNGFRELRSGRMREWGVSDYVGELIEEGIRRIDDKGTIKNAPGERVDDKAGGQALCTDLDKVRDKFFRVPEPVLNTFMTVWKAALSKRAGSGAALRVLEVACGSANDYRFVAAAGMAQEFDYTGIDISRKNIENARAMFPQIRFEVGNVFALPFEDGSFDLCITQDLFEHLSPEGIEAGVRELSRVARKGLCLGFFQMEEGADDIIRPLEEYHWNLLSLERMCDRFERFGWKARIFHIGTLLREWIGCEWTHNPNAYTLYLWRE